MERGERRMGLGRVEFLGEEGVYVNGRKVVVKGIKGD